MATPQELATLRAGREDRIITVESDVRDHHGIAQAVDAAIARWGRLDVAVAAAAVIAGGRPLWQTPATDLELLWDVDVKGVWNTAATAVPAMLAGPDPAGCRFIAVSSAAGTHGLFRLAAYNAAKHAVVGLVKGLAADLVGTGVTAVAVSPGSTDTAMLRATVALYDDVGGTGELGRHGLIRRVIAPREIAATIAHCASLDGGILNGTTVHADGGFVP